MYSEFRTRFSCDSMTPLGVPVEPEVYCKTASFAGDRLGSAHESANSSGTLSVLTQCSDAKEGCSAINGPIRS